MAKVARVFANKWVIFIVFTVVYIVAAKLSLRLAFLNASATAVWPPTGMAIGAMVLTGTWLWPAVLLGAFITNLTTAGSLATSVAIAVGNTLEAVIAANLITRWAGGKDAFTRARYIFLFTLFAGVVGPAVSATIGVTSLAVAGYVPWTQYAPVWLTWWLGDLGGALVVAPVVVLWFINPTIQWRLPRLVEGSGVGVILLIVAGLVFGVAGTGHYPLEFLTIPTLVWFAFRFGQRETATAVLLLAAVAIWGTIHGMGPFALGDTNTSLVLLQSFLGIMAMTKLMLAAAVVESQHANQALVHSEKRFRALIEHSSDAVALLDLTGKILYVSAPGERLLGYPSSEVVGTTVLHLVHPDDRKTVVERLTHLAQQPADVVTVEIRVRHKDGYWLWVESVGTNLLSEPAVRAIVVNYRDITQRKQLEEAKNEFLSIAAHQLRGPLSSMRWQLELLLKKTKLLAPAKAKVTQIYDSSLRVITLVNEFFDVSRIVQGVVADVPETLDIVAALEREIDTFGPLCEQHKVSLKLTTIGTIPPVMLDPKRFAAVIQNLLANAIVYSGGGKGTVTVQVTGKGDTVEVSVADNGIGISPQDQKKIFTKFFRAPNAIAFHPDGTGLGLFVVQSYVNGWQGTVWFKSPTLAKDRGTTFYVSVPVKNKGGSV